MSRPPRPPREPIINRFMQVGILIQTIAITSVTLAAYFIGLKWYPAHMEAAQTMAFMTLSASELFRAYTSRSERYPLVKIGIFNNRNMNLACLSSMALLLGVVYIPGLNTVFNTVPLGWRQWEIMLPLVLIPSVIAEIVKMFGLKKKYSQSVFKRARRCTSGKPRKHSGANVFLCQPRYPVWEVSSCSASASTIRQS